MVTVYSLPNCVQCNQTKRLMDREGIDYLAVQLDERPDLAAQFKEEGLMQAPIVMVGNDGRRWTGFRPDLIKDLKSEEA
jgi:glutaredoxin-like protein NrdH